MRQTTFALLNAASLLSPVLSADILKTDGFTNCNNGDSTIEVQNVDISFDKSTSEVTFDVAGISKQEQEVTAELIVTAYGVEVYSQSFDPCADNTKVEQLCPGQLH
jgi:copper chaperone CopZ